MSGCVSRTVASEAENVTSGPVAGPALAKSPPRYAVSPSTSTVRTGPSKSGIGDGIEEGAAASRTVAG